MDANPALSVLPKMMPVAPAPLPPAASAPPHSLRSGGQALGAGSGEWDNVLGCGAPGPDRGRPALFNQAPPADPLK